MCILRVGARLSKTHQPDISSNNPNLFLYPKLYTPAAITFDPNKKIEKDYMVVPKYGKAADIGWFVRTRSVLCFANIMLGYRIALAFLIGVIGNRRTTTTTDTGAKYRPVY